MKRESICNWKKRATCVRYVFSLFFSISFHHFTLLLLHCLLRLPYQLRPLQHPTPASEVDLIRTNPFSKLNRLWCYHRPINVSFPLSELSLVQIIVIQIDLTFNYSRWFDLLIIASRECKTIAEKEKRWFHPVSNRRLLGYNSVSDSSQQFDSESFGEIGIGSA